MRTHPLGRSKTEVTELSFGAAGIGSLFTEVSDQDAAEAVAAAWDGGIRSFDTAPHYGLGLSERRLGAALRDRPRAEYTVSTKVGRLLVPTPGATGRDDQGFAVPASHRRVWDFSADGVRRSLEQSLVRLGLDRLDTVLLHDPDDHAEQALTEAYPALERLRAEGVVGAIGVGMNQTALPTRFVRETDLDVVLLAGRCSLLDDSGLDELLPEAARRGVSVIVGGVFNSGLLADPRPGATYDYVAAPDELLSRALRLQQVCERHGVPLRAAAARYPLRQPAVAGVLLGLRDAAQVQDALEQYRRQIPEALWVDLAETAGGALMRVALFITCFNDTLYPDTGKAVVRLLERLGHTVEFPLDQTCCGQMHFNTGYRPEATPLARRFAEVFDGYDAVVSPSASCTGMVRDSHELLTGQRPPRVYELSEFLVDVLGVTDVGAYFPHRVTYHPTCHSLRMLRVGDKPLRLLRAVKGIDLVELPAADSCCGFGGTFALKNAGTSAAMLADKADCVRGTGAEVLSAADNSCLMHIGGGLSRLRSGVRTLHLAEILAATEGDTR